MSTAIIKAVNLQGIGDGVAVAVLVIGVGAQAVLVGVTQAVVVRVFGGAAFAAVEVGGGGGGLRIADCGLCVACWVLGIGYWRVEVGDFGFRISDCASLYTDN